LSQKQQRQNGNTYIGMYQDHKRHGDGTFVFANGSEFIGSFRNNKFVHGIYTWNNGRVYDGDWDNTLRHGFGRYTWPDNRRYEGEWKRDKRDGHGLFFFCFFFVFFFLGYFVVFFLIVSLLTSCFCRKIYLAKWRSI
jgi:hypothetical protein